MNDQNTVRLVIGILGAVAVAVIIGSFVLAADDRAIPGELVAMGSLAVGAVAGILSKTATNDPQPVEVVNRNDEPVPVNEAGNTDIVTICVVIIAVVAVLFALGVVPT